MVDSKSIGIIILSVLLVSVSAQLVLFVEGEDSVDVIEIEMNYIHHEGNSGEDWIQQYDSDIGNIRRLFFIDSNIGWAMIKNGKLLKTTNSGNDWELYLSYYSEFTFTDISFIDNVKGRSICLFVNFKQLR